jgi:Putative bacterial sensory transduction regulator
MPDSPIASPQERARCDAAISGWAASVGTSEGTPLLAVEHDPDLARWYVRLKGEEKDVVTIWFTIRQRTLRHETHFMPAPETNVCETYEYLLRRNSSMHGLRFCLGSEGAVFLVGELPVAEVSQDDIDRVIGASLEYVDSAFPAAMSMGYAGTYKRRPRRR